MAGLANRRILLGVTGGIAAYKSCELVRRLREAGAEVRVVMTQAATAFVTPLSFQALSGQPVRTDLMDPAAEAAMGHIELARWADRVVVAPASADFLARLAQGRADDLLATLCLATEAPITVVPAMNRAMWQNAATRHNVAVLRERGVTVMEPASGAQACGEQGPGRMLEPGEITAALAAAFDTGVLAGLHVLVTAGPTREAIDPVRFISNRSSGRMGHAVAEAARDAGARVTLISGPVALAPPERVERVEVETAEEMYRAVMGKVAECDIFIAAAAVADYRPAAVAGHKIKKKAAELALPLTRTPDILASVARLPDRPFCVGFAAETERLVEHARAKRMAKGLDLVAANLVGRPDIGFDAEDNALLLVWEGGQAALPRAPKSRLARELVATIARLYGDRPSRRGDAEDSAQDTG